MEKINSPCWKQRKRIFTTNFIWNKKHTEEVKEGEKANNINWVKCLVVMPGEKLWNFPYVQFTCGTNFMHFFYKFAIDSVFF